MLASRVELPAAIAPPGRRLPCPRLGSAEAAGLPASSWRSCLKSASVIRCMPVRSCSMQGALNCNRAQLSVRSCTIIQLRGFATLAPKINVRARLRAAGLFCRACGVSLDEEHYDQPLGGSRLKLVDRTTPAQVPIYRSLTSTTPRNTVAAHFTGRRLPSRLPCRTGEVPSSIVSPSISDVQSARRLHG